MRLFASLVGLAALAISGLAQAQEIVAFEKRAGEQRRLIQRVVYRNEGWRNLRLVHFEVHFDTIERRPMAPESAYYVCGERLLLIPTSTWQIRNDEFTQYRGVSEGQTIVEPGYNVATTPDGFRLRFAINSDEYPAFLQGMARVCADTPDRLTVPENIVLATGANQDPTLHYLRAGRFSRDTAGATFWSETQRLRKLNITAVFSPGTSDETSAPLEVYVLNESVGHELTQFEVQCSSGNLRSLQQIRYGAQGNVLSSQEAARDLRANPYSEVAPGTVGEASLELVCSIQ